jgi:hypothetical protein
MGIYLMKHHYIFNNGQGTSFVISIVSSSTESNSMNIAPSVESVTIDPEDVQVMIPENFYIEFPPQLLTERVTLDPDYDQRIRQAHDHDRGYWEGFRNSFGERPFWGDPITLDDHFSVMDKLIRCLSPIKSWSSQHQIGLKLPTGASFKTICDNTSSNGVLVGHCTSRNQPERLLVARDREHVRTLLTNLKIPGKMNKYISWRWYESFNVMDLCAYIFMRINTTNGWGNFNFLDEHGNKLQFTRSVVIPDEAFSPIFAEASAVTTLEPVTSLEPVTTLKPAASLEPSEVTTLICDYAGFSPQQRRSITFFLAVPPTSELDEEIEIVPERQSLVVDPIQERANKIYSALLINSYSMYKNNLDKIQNLEIKEIMSRVVDRIQKSQPSLQIALMGRLANCEARYTEDRCNPACASIHP